MLGGTGNIGPHYVQVAVNRGHQVTVFSRGRGDISLPAGVERLIGDRNGNVESITDRDWDSVVDLAVYGPVWIRSLGSALAKRVKHYTFISTISVYGVPAPDNAKEDTPVLTYTGSEDPYTITSPGRHYGALKALCERESEAQFPGRTLILRPGYIVGSADTHGALTYWPARMEKAGEMLVAGDPSAPVQFIDVRDLAEWTIRLIEARITGTFNAVGPTSPMKFDQMLATAQSVVSTSPILTWVPGAWLTARGDKEIWRKLLFWTNEPGGFAGTMSINIERAIEKGLTVRPLSVTYMDGFSAYKGQIAAHSLARGLATVDWPTYLTLEREVLAAWRARQK